MSPSLSESGSGQNWVSRIAARSAGQQVLQTCHHMIPLRLGARECKEKAKRHPQWVRHAVGGTALACAAA
eukprot:16429959-Heterocapsa_arctica.AAC.1